MSIAPNMRAIVLGAAAGLSVFFFDTSDVIGLTETMA